MIPLPALNSSHCQVWWAISQPVPAHLVEMLTDVERERRARLRYEADRDRFTSGVVVSRMILAAHLALRPAAVRIDRSCMSCGAPHGRPRTLDGDLDFSVSHAGDLVAMAVVRRGPEPYPGGRRVGVDVEVVTDRVEPRARELCLSAPERDVLNDLPDADRAAAFFRYWVRKEAVLKATGDGLAVPMRDLTLSRHDEPAALRAWAYRPAGASNTTLADLTLEPVRRVGANYAGALAVIGPPVTVDERDATALLHNGEPW